jgi:two-component system phosphate regulon sensor histidine kinase PhoR
MLSAKNLNPQQLSAVTAIIIALPISIAIYYFQPLWIVAVIALVIIFFGTYGLILFMVQQFVYRKIKLIYKLIYQTKASKREEFYYKNILPQKSIDEVRIDVENWGLQKKAQIEILQQNEAYRKEFLQNLSHELKTPIFAIQGYVDTLINGALENPAVNKKFLASTSRNIDRLVNLVDDLDEISKLEAGEQLLYTENFVVQDLVKDVFESLALQAEAKQIKLLIKKGCEVPLVVYADKEKMRQVFINLVENAIKYGKQHGKVEASVYRIDSKKILIEISDDGFGIGEEHLSRIFERFYRTDTARSRKVGGSGLGLSICKHIIEAHGQAIHVRSTLDVGSTFGFTLQSKKD